MIHDNQTKKKQLRQYANLISRYRNEGDLENALAICSQAIHLEPENNFFYKIQGDIFRQKQDWSKASESYLLQLKYLGEHVEYFEAFKKFYQQLKKKTSLFFQMKYRKRIREEIQKKSFSEPILNLLVEYLGDELELNDDEWKILELSENDENYKIISTKMKAWKKEGELKKFVMMADYKLQLPDGSNSLKIDHDLILTLSSNGEYRYALEMIQKRQKADSNRQMAALMLRNCRMLKDYSVAEKTLPLDSEYISRADFNVLYELVYYFSEKKDELLLQRTLKGIQSAAESSIPIAKTLYNFYLSFGKFEEAQLVYEHIQQMQQKSRKKEEQSQFDRSINEQESEQVVWQKMKELSTEQEHARQMIALKDLLKGFSHELGQPITNIRYAIQLQQMKRRMGKNSQEDLDELFGNILKQTERIDSLLTRFRPMVSSKEIAEWFSVQTVIEDVFRDLEGRLKGAEIQYRISSDRQAMLFGDPIQFSQVFYNLVLNSIQAITADRNKDDAGKIWVKVTQKKKLIKIEFADNGPGIPKDKQHKVFEPFYTTKDPTAGNGGEGLGLYIVWNVLKMFNGTVHIDENYERGAKFIIEIKEE